MKTLTLIQQELATGQFEFSRHALRRVVERKIITIYEPEPNEWIDYRKRR